MPPKIHPAPPSSLQAVQAAAPMMPPAQMSRVVRDAADANARRIAERARMARRAAAPAPVAAAPVAAAPAPAPVAVAPAVLGQCRVCLDDVTAAEPVLRGHCGMFHRACLADLTVEQISQFLLLSRVGAPAVCSALHCNTVVDPAQWVDVLGPDHVRTLNRVATPVVIVAPVARNPALSFLGLFYCKTCNIPQTWESGCDLLSPHPCIGGPARYHVVDGSVRPEAGSGAIASLGPMRGVHSDCMSALVIEATALCGKTAPRDLLAQLKKLSRFHAFAWRALGMDDRIAYAESGRRWPSDEIIRSFKVLGEAINATVPPAKK
jgi:hypothetical protein